MGQLVDELFSLAQSAEIISRQVVSLNAMS